MAFANGSDTWGLDEPGVLRFTRMRTVVVEIPPFSEIYPLLCAKPSKNQSLAKHHLNDDLSVRNGQ
jgi:hypothetical protein